jgi:peroxiredoxin
MNDWHVAWAGRGARVIAISIDIEVRNARRFVEKANLSLDVFHDGPEGLARKLDLVSLPYTCLLDREGNVVSVLRSSSAKDLAALQQTVESMLTSPRRAAVQEAGMNAAAGQLTSGVRP